MAAAGGQLGHIGLAEVIAPPLQPVAGEDPADEHVLATLPASYILFVGALRIVKGVETLLRAYATLVDPPPLILMGSRTPDTPDLSVNGVRVVEGANNATVLRAWDRALFGVSPSVLPEPLGLVVLEAMRHGRAVIGSRPGGHEELIEHGHTGLLVAGGDTEGLAAAMQALTDDSALRQRMGERARTKAAEYDPQVLVARIETLLQGAIARAKALPGPPPQRDQR